MKRNLLVLLLVMPLAASCLPEEDVGATRADRDALLERMEVRVVRDVDGEMNEIRFQPEEYAAELERNCQADISSGPLSSICGQPTNNCEITLCLAEVAFCVANELMSTARIVAPELVRIQPVGSSGPEDWMVAPQSPATNAGLAQQSIFRAETASRFAGFSLFFHRTPQCSLPSAIDVANGETQPGTVYAASILIEAYHLASDEAPRALGEFTTAVADAYFSDEAQIRDATELAHVAPLLSRRGMPTRSAAEPTG